MGEEQILEKAIEKANVKHWNEFLAIEGIDYTMRFVNEIILSHDFAKAFWGKQKELCDCRNDSWCERCFIDYKWQYHLQQMVLEKEPLKYLEKFL